MKVFFKRIILAAVLFAILLCFAACVQESPVETPNQTPNEMEDKTPKENKLELVSGGKPVYRIVRPEKSSAAEIQAVNEIKNAIQRLTGEKPEVVEDWTDESLGQNESAFEILVGRTNRKETDELLSTLKVDGWAVSIVKTKLVIVAHSDKLLLDATKYFTGQFIGSRIEGYVDSLSFTENDIRIINGEYLSHSLILCGENIKKYSIVYAENNRAAKRLARLISEYIAENYGERIDVLSDTSARTTSREILVGNTARTSSGSLKQELAPYLNCEKGYATIACSNGTILLAGGGDAGLSGAFGRFCELIAPSPNGHTSVTLEKCLSFEVSGISLMALSANLDGMSKTDVSEAVARMKAMKPDIIGFQNVSRETLLSLENELGDIYLSVSVEKDAEGESNPIFYNKDKFSSVMEGAYWLSDTPHVSSKLEGAKENRLMTYAVLSDIESDTVLVYANATLDSSSEINSVQSEIVTDMLNDYAFAPVILTGAFGFGDKGGIGYSIMINDGYIDACYGDGKNGHCFVLPEYAAVTEYKEFAQNKPGEAASVSFSQTVIELIK